MDALKAINYLEESFLKDLLCNQKVTDISYNGEDVFYVNNDFGRLKSEVTIEKQAAKDFVRQIANLSEKQFSFQSPKLDVSLGRYRFNALHQSICRKNNEESVTFSIRIASSSLKFNEDNCLCDELKELLKVLIDSNVSIVIGGQTGSGKTELQKYLISLMKENTRTIVIDNILELDQFKTLQCLDLNIWQVDEKREEASIENLVRNALRSNPDWLIVAESRGKEMLDVLNSSLTGHPIITTLHAFDIESMPHRMVRMVMMNEQKMEFKDVYYDISYHMRFYIYLKRQYLKDGYVSRYISSISFLGTHGMENIYSSDGNKIQFRWLSKEAIKMLDLSNVSDLFKATFLGGKK